MLAWYESFIAFWIFNGAVLNHINIWFFWQSKIIGNDEFFIYTSAKRSALVLQGQLIIPLWWNISAFKANETFFSLSEVQITYGTNSLIAHPVCHSSCPMNGPSIYLKWKAISLETRGRAAYSFFVYLNVDSLIGSWIKWILSIQPCCGLLRMKKISRVWSKPGYSFMEILIPMGFRTAISSSQIKTTGLWSQLFRRKVSSQPFLPLSQVHTCGHIIL